MAQTMVNFRMDEELKRNMEQTCKEMGLTLSAAFTMFAMKVTRDKKIPFEVSALPDGAPDSVYRLELEFDKDRLSPGELEKLYERTDRIFLEEDLRIKLSGDKRIYMDRGREKDYGKMWAAILEIRHTGEICKYLKECLWYDGTEQENLLREFIEEENEKSVKL